jgi:hypothetical protein
MIMTNAELTVVRTYMTAMDAEIARSALEAAGIAAVVRADDCGGQRPHMQMSGVDVLVRAEDATEASAVLDSPQSTSIPEEAEPL